MEKKAYISPEIEVVEIAVEKGFATSGGEATPSGAGWSDIEEW